MRSVAARGSNFSGQPVPAQTHARRRASAPASSTVNSLPGAHWAGDVASNPQQQPQSSARALWAQPSAERSPPPGSKSAPAALPGVPQQAADAPPILPDETVGQILIASLGARPSAADITGLRSVSRNIRRLVDDHLRGPAQVEMALSFTADTVTNMARSTALTNNQFRGHVFDLVNRSAHVGLNFNGIRDQARQNIALNQVAAATHLISVDITVDQDLQQLQASLTAVNLMAHQQPLTRIGLDVSHSLFARSGQRVRAVSQSPVITHLVARHCRMGAPGVQALATNTNIRQLDVSGNHIRDAGAQALAANTTLQQLDVSQNQIGDVGAQALAANTTLRHLDVSGNRITPAGVEELRANTTLTSLQP